jgi:hypothetical protein
MQPETQTAPDSKKMLWAGYITSALPVLGLLFSGALKLVRPDLAKETFDHLGWDESFALGLGILELACTVVYVIPRIGDPFYYPIIFGVLVWGGLWLRDGRLRALVPWRS